MSRENTFRGHAEDQPLACVGLENQTEADPDMTLRVMGYDGAEYRAQLLADNSVKNRYPVVTLVLYFGYEKRWNKPRRLKGNLEIPQGKPFGR